MVPTNEVTTQAAVQKHRGQLPPKEETVSEKLLRPQLLSRHMLYSDCDNADEESRRRRRNTDAAAARLPIDIRLLALESIGHSIDSGPMSLICHIIQSDELPLEFVRQIVLRCAQRCLTTEFSLPDSYMIRWVSEASKEWAKLEPELRQVYLNADEVRA